MLRVSWQLFLMKNRKKMFKIYKRPGEWTITARTASDRKWPFPDGMISASNGRKEDVQIALEYKRPNETVHGILTAIGQCICINDFAKGYQGMQLLLITGLAYSFMFRSGCSNYKFY